MSFSLPANHFLRTVLETYYKSASLEISDFRVRASPSNCQASCFLSVSLFNATSLVCRQECTYITTPSMEQLFVSNAPLVSAFPLFFATSSCSSHSLSLQCILKYSPRKKIMFAYILFLNSLHTILPS